LSAVVKATVWLTEVSDFAAFNRIYAQAFADTPPVRSTVVSGLVMPGAKVEIEVIAYAPAVAS
jgi:2-iminobutanoate/2-iminopropanoate deaminase